MSDALPTWDQFMIPALRVMADGGTRALREIRDLTVGSAGLTQEQLDEQSDSGYSKATNRIGWAVSYLKRVGALDRPTRGQYVITKLGHDLLVQHPAGLTERELRGYAQAGDRWWLKASTPAAEKVEERPALELDPIEMIDDGTARIHAAVAADLLSRLHGNAPGFFEQAVLGLLIAIAVLLSKCTSWRL